MKQKQKSKNIYEGLLIVLSMFGIIVFMGWFIQTTLNAMMNLSLPMVFIVGTAMLCFGVMFISIVLWLFKKELEFFKPQ